MTNLWPAINTLRMEATRLRQTSKRMEAAEGMDIAANVLEAAGRVDKVSCMYYVHHARAIQTLDEIVAYAGKWQSVEQESQRQILFLLAAMPDGDKGEPR